MSNQNEPAFPTPNFENRNGDVQWGAPGITKLEYFAGLAMQGLLANYIDDPGTSARHAVERAKALIAELDKVQP